ncbi:acetate/propionate family kinase [Ligilactobacillus araffinosus]|uniref:Acetate kinase n=1 Tax=Ligilactobacillus araffinosus DSM 20653 TaxID=1423820 RepID=A0A0R1ZDU3_9LACO|nr:acetate kinase [Ligilactobacillus araffinosus]KRM52894.1 acetate kinase [Ligilactobacillus araffinosus DSM 20653]
MEKTLVINSGSSTLKFKLYLMPEEKEIAKGLLERIGFDGSAIKIVYNDGKKYTEELPLANHAVAIKEMLRLLKELKIVDNFEEITGVGHRVVAGGEYFDQSVVIDDDVIQKIDELADFAPLHNPNNLIGIQEFKKLLPDATAVAVFDTAFHQTLPEENYMYSTPYEWYEKYGVRRYGAHGTSHQFVAEKAAEYLGKPLKDLKMITCHLGAGSSMCAIKDGKSFDTSMGFTPLTGITMGTRSGDVDFSLVAYVMKKMQTTDVDAILDTLNKKSGLLGVSGRSLDMRDLQAAEKDGDQRASLAIRLFIKNIVRYVGQYYAEMGGLDAIVFTAGIGENESAIRKRIIDRLSFMGVAMDDAKNDANVDGVVSTTDSKIAVLRVPTNEELMIARDVERLKNK